MGAGRHAVGRVQRGVGADHGLDGTVQIARVVHHVVGQQGLVEVGVGFGHGRQQQPAVQVVDPLAGHWSGHAHGVVHRGDEPVDDVDVDHPPVGQAGVAQHGALVHRHLPFVIRSMT